LKKQVRFVEFADYHTDYYKDSTKVPDFVRPVQTREELQASAKRVGAVQVFCPRASNAGGYRLSRIFDDVSLRQSPYSGRPQIPLFQVATAYKKKADKVRPVDPGETDGSKPRGCLDWLEKSKADDVPCQLGSYSDWITPKFSDIQKGSRLTEERIKDLIVGDSLWPKERELFIEVLYNREKALAFDFSHIGRVKPDVAPPQIIKTVKHKA
jgi:hypothetical protein